MAIKILMATMGLDIGGAETHIVELVKELKRQGNDVAVASAGGVYVGELEAVGVRHYTVPMARRRIMDMAKSYFLLKKVIKTERPDVVHAHARIPAFLCALVRKTVRFPFVTTAHWVFHVSGALRYLTNWGERTIAVSDDIKTYLMENYGLPEQNISVTINGIDTEKFSPDVSGEKIVQEFSMDTAKPVISHVSRLDEERALAARHLLHIAPELDREIPGVQILIAGGGNVFQELSAQAAAVNEKLGRQCVIMAGPRTDISEIVAAGDVFVGVSRAALEAMSMAKPVVVAGNEGYIGLFESSKLDKAIENNFCCRGCDESTSENLLAGILQAFALDSEKRGEIGRFGRQVILEHYSVKRMTEDCVAAYKAVMPKRRRILMSGYYGFKNMGDEALLQSIYRNIAATDDSVGITVLSNDPEETAARYGYDAVYRFNMFKVLRAIRKCDVLLSGGGSLLQDRTSTRSILYYLFIIRMAEIMGKRVMLYANGVGPVGKKRNRKLVKKAVCRADLVTLRDRESAEELYRMGVRHDRMYVTADPVFTMDPVGDETVDRLLREHGLPKGRAFAAVSVRDWPGVEKAEQKLAAICDKIYEQYGKEILFVAMQLPKDGEICRRIQQQMKSPSHLLASQIETKELIGVTGRADFVISMRLHLLIFAARAMVPSIGIVYDPKIEAYLNMLDMPSVGNIEDFSISEMEAAIEKICGNMAAYREGLKEKMEEQKALARQNETYLLELLNCDRNEK